MIVTSSNWSERRKHKTISVKKYKHTKKLSFSNISCSHEMSIQSKVNSVLETNSQNLEQRNKILKAASNFSPAVERSRKVVN